jgi:hypothetical protein
MFDRLQEAILTVPIPGAPPKMSTSGARIGLAFLDIVLRQNHTRRLTEELTFNNVAVANRVIRQEVSLSFLNPTQYDACLRYGQYRTISANIPPGQPVLLHETWLPLARVSRVSSPPVRVLDSGGEPLPTLIRPESSELFAPAIYRLFRQALESKSAIGSSNRAKNLIEVEHESRWLLQQAVIELTTGKAPAMQLSDHARTPGTAPATGAKRREYLLETLRELNDDGDLTEVLRLLQIVVDEQILIAAVDSSRSDHELTYILPIAAAHDQTDPIPQWRPWHLPRRTGDYLIQYETVIPSGVKSYHLTASTADPNAEMQDAVLVVSPSEEHIQRVVADLSYLAQVKQRYDRGELTAGEVKLLEYDAQNTLKALAEILRRKFWEAQWQGFGVAHDKLTAVTHLAHAAISGEGVLIKQPTLVVHASLVQHPLVTSENFTKAAAELQAADLGSEIVMDTSKESSSANLFWRRSELGLEGKHDLTAQCRIRITDSAAEGVNNIRIFGLTLLLITYLVFAGSYRAIWPLHWLSSTEAPTDVEAKVAILLLVPGFLFTRLELPPRSTIIAELRVWPRLLAHAYIASSLAAAICIACAADATFRTSVSCLIILFQLILQIPTLPDPRGNRHGPGRHQQCLPRWMKSTRRTDSLFRDSDCAFVAVGNTLEN